MKTNLNVLVERDLLSKAKIAAIRNGRTISDYVRDSLVRLADGLEQKGHISEHNAQDILDDYKLEHARLLISTFTMDEIRKHSLANLDRWEESGVISLAYNEWRDILTKKSDIELFEIIVGQNENSNRLRQSPPYVGMLDRNLLRSIRDKRAP